MATFDSLAGDQRAVLQLVLARRRGYEEIASMLSIDQDAVRGRALGALDALGPPTELDTSERRLICDYLLSQLPDAQQARARELLAGSPAARAWAVALTPALEPVAVDPLPRIPPAGGDAPTVAGGNGPAAARSDTAAGPSGASAAPSEAERAIGQTPDKRPSSRTGGIVVIALALAVIIAAIVVLLVSQHHGHSGRGLADAAHTSTTTGDSTTTNSSTSAVKYVSQINLHPAAAGSKAVGVAVVVRDGSTLGIEMFGEHIPPNTKRNSYEVWLYSSPTHFEKLGFVSPAVGKSGRFSVVNALPRNAGGYRELIVTTETAQKPTHPGPILLRGTITGLS